MSMDGLVKNLVIRIRTEFNSLRAKVPVSAKLTTDATGTITWTYGKTFSGLPILTATPELGTRPLVVNIVSVSTTQAVFRVYRLRTQTVVVGVLLEPIEVAPGAVLHMMAVEA